VGVVVQFGTSTIRARLGGRPRRAGLVAAAGLLAALTALSACTTGGADAAENSASAQNTSAPGTSTPTAPGTATSSSSQQDGASLAVITAAPLGKAVSPVTPVTVNATDGTLTAVTLRNADGKKVSGAITADGTSWKNTEVLGYGKSYSLSATAVNSSGTKTVKRASFTTLTPDNMTMPYLNTIYGASLENGATYGVGMIAVVNFDEPIPDRAAAERALQVTTTPHVDGAWTWLDDHTAHWRPEKYYAPGTKVTVNAKVYGVEVGPGLYGQADQKVSFQIGAKHIAIADAKTHKVRVYFDNKRVRTMDTSMGQGGWVDGKNGKISLWTMPGTYTVIGHENPATMSSDSYGLPANSPYGYAPEKVPYATKISTDGIYLHELDSTVGYQGHQNVSHGCLNLNYTNAKWYYNTSRVGDVVKVINSGGPAIKLWQGGDWSVPWATWVKGSALH